MPAVVPITIYQGASWSMQLYWQQPLGTPIADLTGWTAAMQIRATYESNAVLVGLATGSGIIIDGPNAGILLDLTDEQTAAIDVPASDDSCCSGELIAFDGAVRLGVYDLELTSPFGAVTRLMQGVAYFSPEGTRA